MRIKITVLTIFLAVLSIVCAMAEPRKKDSSGAPFVSSSATDDDTLRVEGEQRYRANCGRCHAAPEKFPPRMMATVLRHMRVRATITDEDMRLILHYMTQ
jgi:mono/diheme cytochrome c family protein